MLAGRHGNSRLAGLVSRFGGNTAWVDNNAWWKCLVDNNLVEAKLQLVHPD